MHFCKGFISLQRVEKVVNLEKYVPLHAGQTSRNRDEFRFLASGSCTRVLPRAKNEKRQTAVRIRYPYRCFWLESLCQNGTAGMPSPTKENAMLRTFVLA